MPALTGRHGTVRLVVVLQSLPVVCPPEACCPLGMGERDLKSESADVTGPQQVADSLPVQLPKVPGPGRKLVPQAEVSQEHPLLSQEPYQSLTSVLITSQLLNSPPVGLLT